MHEESQKDIGLTESLKLFRGSIIRGNLRKHVLYLTFYLAALELLKKRMYSFLNFIRTTRLKQD